MPRKSLCLKLCLLLALALAPAARAQVSEWAPEEARLGLAKQVSSLLDKKVGDNKDRTLGRVQDLIVDLANGSVPVVLVSIGSDQIVPVPSSTFSDASVSRLVMNLDKKSFAQASRVPQGQPLQALSPKTFDECFRHFGGKSAEPPSADPAHFSLASRLLGVPLRSRSSELLGTVKDITVDLPRGRIVYLVIEPAAQSGAHGDFYVVPPSAVELDAAGAALVLKFERAHFVAGPCFQKEFWNDMAFPALANAVREHYGADADAPNNRLTLVAQASSIAGTAAIDDQRSDRALTQAVLGEIVRTTTGFQTLHIAVTTTRGHITLSGRVKNEKQKKQVVGAAERIVGSANVEDHLEIGKAASVSS